MRILLDMQSLQTGSRLRGIGRYSLSLVRGMVQGSEGGGQGHVFDALLNGAFRHTVRSARESLVELIDPSRIHLWQPWAPTDQAIPPFDWRRAAGLLLRQYAIESLAPDVVLTTSLFEGSHAVTPVSAGGVTKAVIQYDLVPLSDPQGYLADPADRRVYHGLLDSLRQADVLLAISDYSRQEAIDALGIPADRVVAISSDADPIFRPLSLDAVEIAEACRRLDIPPGFLLYAGNVDARKNLHTLVEAFALLPARLRREHPLVVLADCNDEQRFHLTGLCRQRGIDGQELRLLGRVDDDTLVFLYNACHAFVFPSRHEGFGLPVLEAMRCGAAVIASKTTSIPEVVGCAAALFDPNSPTEMAEKMAAVLTDEGWRQQLKAHAGVQAGKFSWDATARRALAAIEEAHERRLRDTRTAVDAVDPLARRRRLVQEIAAIGGRPQPGDLAAVAVAIDEATPGDHPRQLLVDGAEDTLLAGLSQVAPAGWRVEPVRRWSTGYLYDRDGAPATVRRDDIFIALDAASPAIVEKTALAERSLGWLAYHRLRGLKVYLVAHDRSVAIPEALADGLFVAEGPADARALVEWILGQEEGART